MSPRDLIKRIPIAKWAPSLHPHPLFFSYLMSHSSPETKTQSFHIWLSMWCCLVIIFALIPFASCADNEHHDFLMGEWSRQRWLSTIPASDVDLLEFPLNLEYLEAEFFLWGSLGCGLDKIEPILTMGGPSPVGGRIAKLDPFTKDVIYQFALQEIGHLRAIKNTVKGFPRPLLNLSSAHFADVIDSALGHPLRPRFDPYANSLNYLLASYVIPYVGLTGYVGANPKLQSSTSKRLVAGLLAVESGQDAVIRALLYRHAADKVEPYGDITVAELTDRISQLRNWLGHRGVVKDEGLVVSAVGGPEERSKGNVISGDEDSLGYARTPEEILRIVYSTSDERFPGGFFPMGADGRIARSHLHKS